ncbi:MAG: Wzz/FepE/Etk N-terminal domain-containing protein [Pseudomonadota bacterium]
MDDEINLLDYWRVIVKWKWIIIVMTLIIASGALVLNLKQPKLYKATVTLMPVGSGGGGLASALAAVPFFGGGGGGGGEATLFPILKSTTLAKQVAQSLDLQEFFPMFSPGLSREEKIKSAAGALRGAVNAMSSEGLLNVSIIWSNPDHSAELANRYVEQLGKFLNMRSININFHVIDPAIPPSSPINRKTKEKVMVGGIVGFFMGIFIAFSLEYLRNNSKASKTKLTHSDT